MLVDATAIWAGASGSTFPHCVVLRNSSWIRVAVQCVRLKREILEPEEDAMRHLMIGLVAVGSLVMMVAGLAGAQPRNPDATLTGGLGGRRGRVQLGQWGLDL